MTHGARLHAVLARIAGAPVRAHDYMFLRAAPVGRTTGLHFDYPFFTRATERVYTAWVPLGDVPATDGPLVIVEGSHRFADLHEGLRGFDVVVRHLAQGRRWRPTSPSSPRAATAGS